MVFDAATWIITTLSIIGVILNAQKKTSGFYFWMATNAAWVIIDLRAGIYAQAVLFGFYFVMCIYGIREWSKDDQPRTP